MTLRQWYPFIFSLYFITILVPLYWYTSWYEKSIWLDAVYYARYFAFLSMTCLVFWPDGRRGWGFNSSAVFFIPFLIFSSASVFWSIDIASTGIAVASLVVYGAALARLGSSDDFNRAMYFSAIVTLISLALLAVILGPKPRTFGGIQPNLLAQFAFSSLVMLAFAKRLKLILALICISIIVYAQARTVSVGLFVFIIYRYLVLPVAKRLEVPGFSLLFTFISFVLSVVLYNILIVFLIGVTSALFGIDMKERLDVDLTGRTEYWEFAYGYILDSPLLGYGFGTREQVDFTIGYFVNSHSGFINLVLDLGVIGSLLFLTWYISAILISLFPKGRMSDDMSMTNASVLLAFIPIMYSQPLYLGWYDPGAIIMLLCMVLPFVNICTTKRGRRLLPSKLRRKPSPSSGNIVRCERI